MILSYNLRRAYEIPNLGNSKVKVGARSTRESNPRKPISPVLPSKALITVFLRVRPRVRLFFNFNIRKNIL